MKTKKGFNLRQVCGENVIVAEGVETKSQLETMESLGIQYIQGYYFSKPLSEQHFLEFIKEKNVGKTGGVA